MEPLRILVCCGAGLTGGMLAGRLEQEARRRELPITASARSEWEVRRNLGRFDLLLLAPHLSAREAELTALVGPSGARVLVIPEDLYRTMDAGGLIQWFL